MSVFALVDCNNFYVSCERIFNPRLERRAIIVLSNNDGCVVARSQEAKDLGIPMGEPFFKIRTFCELRNIIVYSSNYQLYGNISERVMDVLTSMTPEIQIYSIDEAFLKFPQEMEHAKLVAHCKEIRHKIRQWVGIPVSIGIAPTKTLAKAASRMAKQTPDNVFDLRSPDEQTRVLSCFPVGDLWGVGRQTKGKLHSLGIRTAEDLRSMNPAFIRRQLGVVGERLLLELQGVSCLSLNTETPNKSITCSRSFGKQVTTLEELTEALAHYTATACEKLRNQKSCVTTLYVYAETSINPQTELRRYYSATTSFPLATNDTAQVISAAKSCLPQLFHPGERYKKCGIVLLDLIQEKNVIPDLFLGGLDPKKQRLLKTVDSLNAKFGKESIFYGATGIQREWKMRSENSSCRYTTSWNELPIVK